MRYALAALLFLAALSGPSLAEPAYMEAQRCIWRCLADSKGANDPAYGACVERMCDGKPSSGKRKKASASGPAAEGVWSYGEHPKLGLSAHVTVGEEAFGIACHATPGEPQSTFVTSMRMTPGLLPNATEQLGAVSVFAEPFVISGATTFQSNPLGFYEIVSDRCMNNVSQLQTSKWLFYLKYKFISLDAVKKGVAMTVENNGKPHVIAQGIDIGPLGERVSIPLDGAKAAIGRLIKACPGLRRQMAEPCGTGD